MALTTRIVEIEERGQRFFPRSDLIDPQGRSLILPETRELGALEVKDVEGGINLLALRLIGYLPLTSSITLNIIPKFPMQNLWTMLEIGGESYAKVLPIIRRYQSVGNPAPVLLLARSFCHYLRLAYSAGFERSYYPRTVHGYYKPRVEFGQTISKYLSRGNPVETVSNIFEFGIDSPPNKIIKAACIRMARIMPRTPDWADDRHLVQLALTNLERVREREPTSIDFNLDEEITLRLRANYSGMFRVYQLLLTGGGIAFTFDPGGRELPSFLFNLEDIFERFVRQTFGQALREQKIAVLDGNKHQGKLFQDNKTYPTKTDIIFRRGKSEILALADVKYKPKLKEADRYQIISHVTAANAGVGLLISPANIGESQKLERLGRLPTGAQFFHYRVNIQDDIHTAQAKMVADISVLFQQVANA
jgi:5-methylcytosine-specific restriction endonuclease McrBC regulatory subunit McrC